MQRFEARLRALTWPAPAAGAGYDDWVTWQRATYVDGDSHGAGFWREMHAGVPVNRGTPLRFGAGLDGAVSGSTDVVWVRSDVPRAAVRAYCRIARMPEFALLLASVGASLAADGEVEDVTVRVIVNDRTPRFLKTVGWLSNEIPVQLRADGLADPQRALPAAVKTWLAVLPHQAAPWDFMIRYGSDTPTVRTHRWRRCRCRSGRTRSRPSISGAPRARERAERPHRPHRRRPVRRTLPLRPGAVRGRGRACVPAWRVRAAGTAPQLISSVARRRLSTSTARSSA